MIRLGLRPLHVVDWNVHETQFNLNVSCYVENYITSLPNTHKHKIEECYIRLVYATTL